MQCVYPMRIMRRTHYTIITRTSPLALWQADHIRAQLLHHHPHLEIEIKGIKTTGDRWLKTSLQKIGGKGLFVKELEEALLTGKADLAVHSLKDMPAQLPKGLALVAICERENPLDAWVCPQGMRLEALPSGARVGTSSLRRMVQLRHLRPDLQYLPLRGNVDSRLRRCFDSEWEAIVLAAAGLKRLGELSKATLIFDEDQILPAVGQGALGIECRWDDEETREIVGVLDHAPTRACIIAERAMNAALGGSCHVPIAGFAMLVDSDSTLLLKAKIGHPLLDRFISAQRKGAAAEAIQIGEQVAEDLMQQGAAKIIAESKQC